MFAAMFCCAVVLSSAPATRAGEFFVGGSIGQSSVETNVLDIDTSIDFSGEDTGYKLFGGYALGRHLTFEVAVFDLGTVSDSVFGFDVSSEVYGADAAMTAGVNLFKVANAYIKGGFAWWDVKAQFDSGGPMRFRDTGTDVMWGVGVRFNVGPIFIRGEYEVFELENADEVSLASIGVAYRF